MHVLLLQELLASREEGSQRLQLMTDGLTTVFSGTSLAGKEVMAEAAQRQRREWENIVSEMTEAKAQLEATIMLWTAYGEAKDKMGRWLDSGETQLKEAIQPTTLAERQAHSERLRVSLNCLQTEKV